MSLIKRELDDYKVNRMASGLKSERLSELGLPTLEEWGGTRRTWQWSTQFCVAETRADNVKGTRSTGNPLKMRQGRLEIRRNVFSNREVISWNENQVPVLFITKSFRANQVPGSCTRHGKKVYSNST